MNLRLKLPSGEEKPAWAALPGAVPMIYLFWGPYQADATGMEWVATTAAFLGFLSIYVSVAIFWSNSLVMRFLYTALAALAVAFTAYRPNGILFFIYLAAFAPLTVRGSVVSACGLIAFTILLTIVEYRFFWPPSWFPYIIAGESLLLGAAITILLRQQLSMKRAHKDAERERIARDLHDILGHTLSVVILKAELAHRLFDRDPAKAKSHIQEVERTAREALAEVREAIAGYRIGDVRAEFERAQAALESAGLTVQAMVQTDNLPPADERVLALVVREAVTNIVRHSHARDVVLSLTSSDTCHRLIVRDDGVGLASAEGNGMRGIRERVTAIGGEVAWTKANGTELVVTLPTANGTRG